MGGGKALQHLLHVVTLRIVRNVLKEGRGSPSFWLLGLRGRRTPHASKKGSEKVLGRVLRKGSQKGS